MKSPKFRIVPLPTEIADQARRAAEAGAADHAFVTADTPTGFPCRHCLRWAQPGERMILFPYASIPAGRPYAESGPIFVHAEPCLRYSATQEYPVAFRSGRVLRAYDADEIMVDARILDGAEPEALIESLLEDPQTKFLQARSATRGCFTMRIERA